MLRETVTKVLVEGNYLASVQFSCKPSTHLNLRPILTVEGEIVEWQLLLDPQNPHVDYREAVSPNSRPLPGRPVLSDLVIRFHPDDVQATIDLRREMACAVSNERKAQIFREAAPAPNASDDLANFRNWTGKDKEIPLHRIFPELAPRDAKVPE